MFSEGTSRSRFAQPSSRRRPANAVRFRGGRRPPRKRTNLPAPVDLVLIVDTYHHIPDRVAYFERLRQDLTRSGRVAIIDVTKDSPSGPPVEFRFDPEQITGELSRAGYDLVAQHDFLPRQMFLIYEAR